MSFDDIPHMILPLDISELVLVDLVMGVVAIDVLTNCSTRMHRSARVAVIFSRRIALSIQVYRILSLDSVFGR